MAAKEIKWYVEYYGYYRVWQKIMNDESIVPYSAELADSALTTVGGVHDAFVTRFLVKSISSDSLFHEQFARDFKLMLKLVYQDTNIRTLDDLRN